MFSTTENILSRCRALCLTVMLLLSTYAAAQPVCRVSSFFETSQNEPIHHVIGILQDKNGMIWITTWGGMFSFDGVQFTIHREQDMKAMGYSPEKTRGVLPCPTGDQWQMVHDKKQMKITDSHGTVWRMTEDGRLMYAQKGMAEQAYAGIAPFEGYRGCFLDRQNNLWVLCYHAIHKLVFGYRDVKTLKECDGEHVRSMHRMRNGDYWICQRNSKRVLIYDSHDRFRGYLTDDGAISQTPSSFGARVYCIYEGADGCVWMGTRKDGLFRLTPADGGGYVSEQMISSSAKHHDVYDMVRDRHGRIWLAMLDGGVRCISEKTQPQSTVLTPLRNYDYRNFSRVHNLCMYNDTLLVASSEGLAVADVSATDMNAVKFKYHKYDKERENSLSSNLTDYVYVDSQGRMIVCTENGGLNVCTSASLMADNLDFEHIDRSDGLSDIAFAVSESDGMLCVTSLYSAAVIGEGSGMETRHIVQFGSDFFGSRYQFAEIPPIKTASGRWLFATTEGVLSVNPAGMTPDTYSPRIMPVSFTIAGEKPQNYTDIPERITLKPGQRSFKITFAALDYRNPDAINYAYRLKGINDAWIPLGRERSISFSNIAPDDYTLEIRSTDSNGRWTDNTLCIELCVPARFTETKWATALFVLIGIMLAYAAYRIVAYIRHTKRKHDEVLKAYLSLIGRKEYAEKMVVAEDVFPEKDEEFVRKLTGYINENLSDTTLQIDMIASHMAVSVSTLTRMTKSAMGVTPGEFLAKARIRRASMLLSKHTHATIAEVAYECGFSDPKYFSRCFKSEMKMTPSEYIRNAAKNQNEETAG